MIKLSSGLDFREEMDTGYLKKMEKKVLPAKADDLETEKTREMERTSSASETFVLSMINPDLLPILSPPVPEVFSLRDRTSPARHRSHPQEAGHV